MAYNVSTMALAANTFRNRNYPQCGNGFFHGGRLYSLPEPTIADIERAQPMAKMIPSRILDENVSTAEAKVFNRFESDPQTEGWTVLHSLGLARREAGPYGEIDFVVIIPGEGIVCLEVKGGRVTCEEGTWRTKDRSGKVSVLKKSPFLQSRESMFALKDTLKDKFGFGSPEHDVPMSCGVVFTDVVCPPKSTEFERCDVIDRGDLKKPISKSIMRLARARLREHQRGRGPREPDVSTANSIRNFFRPDFDLIEAKSVLIGRIERKLISLTEEQYERLDELEANPRCLFEGAAGTGKTLLAIEFARRASLNGQRVALLCFNKLLSEELKAKTDDTEIHAGTWHGLANDHILKSSIADDFQNEEEKIADKDCRNRFFNELYPEYHELALDDLGAQFDVVVMDEAQDVLKDGNAKLLNLMLEGGLAEGRWAIFGDFTRQALYGNRIDPATLLEEHDCHFARARLKRNCRNTKLIAEATVRASGFEDSPYSFSDEDGLPVDFRSWIPPQSAKEALGTVIERLLKDGMQINDIVVLAPHKLEKTSLAGTERILKYPLQDISQGGTGTETALRFSTAHSFKGLESPVAILLDFDEFKSSEPQSVLYVAMSRARSLLVFLSSQEGIAKLRELIKTDPPTSNSH